MLTDSSKPITVIRLHSTNNAAAQNGTEAAMINEFAVKMCEMLRDYRLVMTKGSYF